MCIYFNLSRFIVFKHSANFSYLNKITVFRLKLFRDFKF